MKEARPEAKQEVKSAKEFFNSYQDVEIWTSLAIQEFAESYASQFKGAEQENDIEGLRLYDQMVQENAELKKGAEEAVQGINVLLALLAEHGGTIVSTASLSPEWINQARASGRMYVDESGLGFIWEPDIKRIPETVEEVEIFERWYPIEVPLPQHLKTLDWLHKQPPPTPTSAGSEDVEKLKAQLLRAIQTLVEIEYTGDSRAASALIEINRLDSLPKASSLPVSPVEEVELVCALMEIMNLPGGWNDAKQIARKAIGKNKYPELTGLIKAVIYDQSSTPVEVKENCTHEPLIDTGVGYYHCPACGKSWIYDEWKKLSSPQKRTTENSSILKALAEGKVKFIDSEQGERVYTKGQMKGAFSQGLLASSMKDINYDYYFDNYLQSLKNKKA